ncbi:hypothetical protein BST85_01535 [Aureitalea marina]|uniref:Peptidase S8 n=2 Tax=Aureitalea marina TaxID=930804 RepID=A0A2S7KM68_9FLAO|nr:hypothetical protein BST85_01535 [Aureitalea marina]
MAFNLSLFAQDQLTTKPVSTKAAIQAKSSNRFSQEYNRIVNSYDQDKLTALSEKYRAWENQTKKEAETFAKANGIPLKKFNSDGSFDELQRITSDGKLLYYSLDNVDAAVSTRANFLNSGGGLSLNLDGNGMTAYVWDGGPSRPTHVEFDGAGGTNRVSIYDGVTTLNANSFHAQHVTGTIVASGLDPDAKGMAWQADAQTSDWNNDLSEATTAASGGMLISNHSYGFRASNIDAANAWDMFGQYGTDARDWDNLLYNAPYYLQVASAGNDGKDNSSNQFPLDGEINYDKLSGDKTAKNNLVVANGTDASINSGTGL